MRRLGIHYFSLSNVSYFAATHTVSIVKTEYLSVFNMETMSKEVVAIIKGI